MSRLTADELAQLEDWADANAEKRAQCYSVRRFDDGSLVISLNTGGSADDSFHHGNGYAATFAEAFKIALADFRHYPNEEIERTRERMSEAS